MKVGAVWYPNFVKYARRVSAIVVNVLIVMFIFRGFSTMDVTVRHAVTSHLPYVGDVSPVRLAILGGLLWYAFLSQLKIRWALFWLPIYLVLFPIAWVVGMALAAGWRRLGMPETNGAAQRVTPAVAAAKGKRSFPAKRLWIVAFFSWLIALRGLQAWWAVWLPPALTFPVWLWFLRLAYEAAMSPRAFAELWLKSSTSLLESAIKSVQESRARGAKPSEVMIRLSQKLAGSTLGRYSTEKLRSAIHREAIVIFSLALIATLFVSAAFWGLVASAILRTMPGSMSAYHFFSSGGLGESIPWAVGCMTTAISFPGQESPAWLKVLHTVILGTGIFEITYLLACFSVMISTEGARAVKSAEILVPDAVAKLDTLKGLGTEPNSPAPKQPATPPENPTKPG